ncbi:MAG: DivIVA domain-containing protein, partial [Lapillicoccus sp.]
MALTPEHILNKHFQTTQFRKGYDERDVDDFLDEVVAEVRSLIAQRDDLTQQLNECRAARGLPAIPAAGTRTDARADTTTDAAAGRAGTEAETKLAALRQRIADAEEQERQLLERIAHARAEADAAEKDAAEKDGAEKDGAETEATGTLAPEPPGASAGADRDPALEDDGQGGADPGPEGSGGAGAAGLMQLAQRVHDEHVAEGATRRDELIGEGQSRHDELVTTAQSRHDALLAEATALHEQMIAEARERSTGMVA